MCPSTYCHSSLKSEWRQCLCIRGAKYLPFTSPHSLPTWPGDSDTRIVALLENKLRRRLRLPRPDRSAAGCRVPRMVAYRCMTDRYHNHTSPLLSLTYWIKHLPSCSRIAHTTPNSGGKETSWSVFEMSVSNRRQMHDDTRQIRSLKLSLSQTSPNRLTGYLTGLCPRMLQLSFIVERCYLIQNNL